MKRITLILTATLALTATAQAAQAKTAAAPEACPQVRILGNLPGRYYEWLRVGWADAPCVLEPFVQNANVYEKQTDGTWKFIKYLHQESSGLLGLPWAAWLGEKEREVYSPVFKQGKTFLVMLVVWWPDGSEGGRCIETESNQFTFA